MMIQNSKLESQTPKPRKQLVERPNIQTLSLKAIVADTAFQSRIETDPAHVLVFDEMIREGHAIHPVTVFWTGERYILADGFHRYHAHLKRGLESIQAVVLYGSERDAMIHSAGANRLSIKPPTAADRKKAVMMLLADEEWRCMPDSVIAMHTGVSSGAVVKRYRVEHLTREGDIAQLSEIRRKTNRRRCRENLADQIQFSGQNCRLPLSKSRHSEDSSVIARQLAEKGFLCVAAGYQAACMISAYIEHSQKIVFSKANMSSAESTRKAILNVLIVRKAKCGKGRSVVLGYTDIAGNHILEIIDLAKPLGVEFMTPEEFIDSFAVNGKSVRPEEPILD